jgi:hypothetical protein
MTIKKSTQSWRKQKTHREETKAVKDALTQAGFTNVRVGHGTGTAWGWLKIRCDAKPGQSFQRADREVIRIARAVTGRRGDYDGNINVVIDR